MISGLLAEVDARNCWTLGQVLGHPGPHQLQHLLSRATFDQRPGQGGDHPPRRGLNSQVRGCAGHGRDRGREVHRLRQGRTPMLRRAQGRRPVPGSRPLRRRHRDSQGSDRPGPVSAEGLGRGRGTPRRVSRRRYVRHQAAADRRHGRPRARVGSAGTLVCGRRGLLRLRTAHDGQIVRPRLPGRYHPHTRSRPTERAAGGRPDR